MYQKNQLNTNAMLKGIRLTALLAAVFLSAPVLSLAQSAGDLGRAHQYFRNGEFALAEQAYQNIIVQYPGSPEARKAKKQLPLLYVHRGNWSQAQGAYQQLSDDADGQLEVVNRTGNLAYAYLVKKQFQDARNIYRYMIEDWSRTEYSVWIEACRVCQLIQEGDLDAAQSIIEAMLTDSLDPRQGAKVFNKVGDYYRERREFLRACTVYQNVMNRWPQSKYALWALKSLIVSQIRLGQESAAQASIASLWEDYTESEHLPMAVRNIADAYRDMKKYAVARDFYQYIVKSQTSPKLAISALQGVAVTSIKLKDETSAQRAIAKLSNNFSEHPKITEAINHIGDQYRLANQYREARNLYQEILEHRPQDDYAIWAQRGIAVCNIRLKDPNAYEQSLTDLQTGFTGHPQIAKALFQVARETAEVDKDRAKVLCRTIVSNYPAEEYTVFAQAYLGVLALYQGEKKDPNDFFEKLILDHSNHPLLPRVVATIADGYYQKAMEMEQKNNKSKAEKYIRQSLWLWDKILQDYSQASLYTIAEAHMQAADCRSRLGLYDQAISHYRVVVTDYPNFPYAWNAQFLIGRCYEKLKQAGALTLSEADQKIQAAYEKVLQYYPGYPASKVASNWLKRNIQ